MNKKNQSSLIVINKVFHFIRKKNFIFKNKNILLSLSGGQDSLCLLILLFQFKNQMNYYFDSIYINHCWNLDNIYKLSHLLKINYSIENKLFFVIAHKKKFTEKKARLWRYLINSRVALFYGYEILLTGHTATDQIETFLLNLFRSPSKSGISSLFINQLLGSKSIKNIFLSKQNLKI